MQSLENSGSIRARPGVRYNPADYIDLDVSERLRKLLPLITEFEPEEIELAAPLKPFIPDFVPARGGIDDFIKVPRPDGVDDELGISLLDEPSAQQSNPSIMHLKLQSSEPQGGGHVHEPESLPASSTTGRKLENWIIGMRQVQQGKRSAHVHYTKPMPAVDSLLEAWPAASQPQLPPGHEELNLRSLVTLVCNLLDIPVYDNPVESLHLLFSAMLEARQRAEHSTSASLESGVGGYSLQQAGVAGSRLGTARADILQVM
ncbi:hypothetical protein WJX74_005719 [Apatococcus lobatus]|uniref:Intraflagellar transport protein 46 homolog n=1 Tax=Apatococcus lobatus TaxID=904363 RepID=A0AAW1R237_9CHLO